jgi:lipoyl(octanoyl) transferase
MTETWRLVSGAGFDAEAIEPGAEAGHHMAVDESVALAFQGGFSPPTLRIYRWRSPALTIGRFQSSDEIDWEACRRHRIPVARRITGGGAVLHGQDLTYGLVGGTRFRPFDQRSVKETYLTLSRAFLKAFERLGLEARPVRSPSRGESSARCFATPSWHEIAINGRKVIGSAQKRWKHSFLQQGSVPLDFSPETVCRLFRFSGDGERLEAARELGERACGLNDCASRPIRFEALEQAFIAGFEAVLGIRLVPGVLTPQEQNAASVLAREKYLLHEWTRDRSLGLERV